MRGCRPPCGQSSLSTTTTSLGRRYSPLGLDFRQVHLAVHAQCGQPWPRCSALVVSHARRYAVSPSPRLPVSHGMAHHARRYGIRDLVAKIIIIKSNQISPSGLGEGGAHPGRGGDEHDRERGLRHLRHTGARWTRVQEPGRADGAGSGGLFVVGGVTLRRVGRDQRLRVSERNRLRGTATSTSIFGPFLTCFSASCHATRAVGCTLLSAHADRHMYPT